VTRPAEIVLDRAKLGLPPASAAAKGVYAFRRAKGTARGTIVLQGNAVGTTFVTEVLPELDKNGIELNVFYVASAELFDLLPEDEKKSIFTEAMAQQAMGITEFTLPTLYRWVCSERGRQHSMYPFKEGHFLGSGQGARVLEEGHLDAKGQLAAIMRYLG